MFKNNDFYFCPTNDLIKRLPFNFVNGLKDGKWTKLDNKWLKDVKKSPKQAAGHLETEIQKNKEEKFNFFLLIQMNEQIRY